MQGLRQLDSLLLYDLSWMRSVHASLDSVTSSNKSSSSEIQNEKQALLMLSIRHHASAQSRTIKTSRSPALWSPNPVVKSGRLSFTPCQCFLYNLHTEQMKPRHSICKLFSSEKHRRPIPPAQAESLFSESRRDLFFRSGALIASFNFFAIYDGHGSCISNYCVKCMTFFQATIRHVYIQFLSFGPFRNWTSSSVNTRGVYFMRRTIRQKETGFLPWNPSMITSIISKEKYFQFILVS